MNLSARFSIRFSFSALLRYKKVDSKFESLGKKQGGPFFLCHNVKKKERVSLFFDKMMRKSNFKIQTNKEVICSYIPWCFSIFYAQILNKIRVILTSRTFLPKWGLVAIHELALTIMVTSQSSYDARSEGASIFRQKKMFFSCCMQWSFSKRELYFVNAVKSKKKWQFFQARIS